MDLQRVARERDQLSADIKRIAETDYDGMRSKIAKLEMDRDELQKKIDLVNYYIPKALSIPSEWEAMVKERDELKRDLKAAQCNREEWICISEMRKLRLQEAWRLINAMEGQEPWDRARDWMEENELYKPEGMSNG